MHVVASFLIWLIGIYSWIIFFYVLFSWFPHSSGFMGKLYSFLGAICDPFLKPFQKLIKPVSMGNGMAMDFSPIVAFVVLQIVVMILQRVF